LTVGDTLFPYNVIPMVVESIATIVTNDNLTRRIFEFDRGYFGFTDFYIEGIGGAAGLFFPIIQTFESGSFISCVKSNNIIIYETVSVESCDVVSGTTENIISNIIIYPNPAQDVLTVLNKDGISIKRIKIFDVLGEEHLIIKNPSLQFINIDLSEFSIGSFYISIETKQNIKPIIKKIITF